ncbi:hypothetical protein JMJ35_007076 [Cladonia borealis]|uniref:Tat pathway signal sequence n=1 Tax=Cladonia borealis TaxID=184061 RepID=A0AA39V414_9LECA|nr:hypothetical protein JMJ35_007076 [Cladonia borealis]
MFSRLFNSASRTAKYQPMQMENRDVKLNLLETTCRSSLKADTFCHQCSSARKKPQWGSWGIGLYIVLTILNGLFIWGARDVFYFHHMPLARSTKYHLKATSNHSPAFDALDMRLQSTVFNGSLFSLNTSGIFRQHPSPEVDAAWESITRVPNFLVDREDIEKVGKDPSLVVKAPAAWNVGEKYLAALEGHHTMHCLNEVRREVYSDYYFGPTESRHPLRWVHIAHCLDIIRQSLMCSVSVDLITSNWVETQKSPYPDFNVAHQCRDFDAIMQWAQEQQADAQYLERLADIREPPPDALILPMDPGYYELLPALIRYNREHPEHKGHHGATQHR